MRIGIEIGGTFTDLVAISTAGVHTVKVPSRPREPDRGVFDALDRLKQDLGSGLDGADTLIHGSTIATNALLERRGAATALVTTRGFRDILELQRELKSRNYDLAYARTKPLVARDRVIEAFERLDARGNLIEPLDEAKLRDALATLFATGPCDALAVCLLHGYLNPVHERRVREIALELRPGLNVSLSSEVMPEFREYERASTTVMNAYLAPIVGAYLGRMQSELERRAFRGRFYVMQSSGGMLSAEACRGHAVRTLVSGPAAGVTGAIHWATRAGYRDIVTLDMGGTSTDVSLVTDATPTLTTGKLIDRMPVLAPMIDITAIGAGGGSLAWFDGAGMIRIGPRSAGAEPGPACYGRGGTEATLTDACVAMGLLRPAHFLGGAMALDAAAATRAIEPVAARLGFDVPSAAEGMFRIACANMLQATRQVSIERGYDPRDYVIVAYGGAGPLHATVLADEIGAKAVLVPPAPGVLSAMGLVIADFRMDYVRSRVLAVSTDNAAAIRALYADMRAEAERDLATMHPDGTPRIEYAIDLRYQGQGYELQLALDPSAPLARFVDDLLERFHAMHKQRYGHAHPGQAVRAINYRARLVVPQPAPAEAALAASGTPAARETGALRWGGRTIDCRYVARRALGAGERVAGPAVIEEATASTFIPPGWTARVEPNAALLVERTGAAS